MPRERLRRQIQGSAVIWSVVYLAVTVVVLYPVLATPVIADDLFNPFGQFDDAGPGPGSAVRFGWQGATEGASFRIVGNPFGALYNWLWLTLGARLGLSLTTLFAVTKLVVFIAAAAAIAWAWRRASVLYSRQPLGFPPAFGWTSLMLFGSLQIHAGWSNDPVADYPLAGYAAAALGFVTIGTAAQLAHSRRTVHAGTAVLAAAVAVTYYEMNVGAVVGATVLLAAAIVADVRRSRFDLAFLIKAVAVPVVPASLVIIGRFVTGDSASTYSGTTIRLDGAATTFARSLVTSLPGSSWPRSIDHLGGQLGVVFFVFGTLLLVILTVRWSQQNGAAGGPSGDAPPVDRHPTYAEQDDTGRPGADARFGASFVAAVVIYAMFAISVQAITVKVQDEAPGIGYVYTWYAMSSSAVALFLAMAARRVASSPVTLATVVAVVVASSFLFVQNTVNWRLSEQLNQSFGANRRLLDAYDDSVPVEERCATLVQWTSIRWPDYYEDGILDGLQEAFTHYFDEPFCPFGVGDG